jgi:hypothetical protein
MGKWERRIPENEYRLSEESAEAAVRELIDFYGFGVSDMEPSGEKETKTQNGVIETLDKLQEYYRRGLIENRRDETNGFCVVQHTAKKNEIVYREIKPKDKTVLDGFSDTQIYARINALMGKLSGLGGDGLNKMGSEDYRVMEALAIVFLLV